MECRAVRWERSASNLLHSTWQLFPAASCGPAGPERVAQRADRGSYRAGCWLCFGSGQSQLRPRREWKPDREISSLLAQSPFLISKGGYECTCLCTSLTRFGISKKSLFVPLSFRQTFQLSLPIQFV